MASPNKREEKRMGMDWPMTEDPNGPDGDDYYSTMDLCQSCGYFCEYIARSAAEKAADAVMDPAMSMDDKRKACGDSYRSAADSMVAAWDVCLSAMPPEMTPPSQRGAVADRCEVRKFKPESRAEADKPRRIIGYPIVFNELSVDLGGFREQITPGAVTFAEDVCADFGHDPKCILGRVSAGTLKLTQDERGVLMEADVPDTQWARDLVASMDRGDIDQGSFSFRVLPGGQRWEEREDGEAIRTLTSILVSRVTVLSNPAYTQTEVQVRGEVAAEASEQTAGQVAPPVDSGGGVVDLLRRRLDLSLAMQ